MINGKPTADYERILADNGMPVTEEQARAEFEAIVKDEGLITNTSRMSPFWRLITAITTKPVTRANAPASNASLSVLVWETLKHWNGSCSMTGTLFYCALMTPS